VVELLVEQQPVDEAVATPVVGLELGQGPECKGVGLGDGEFGPELIQQLSSKWRIPKNFMFIGSPGDHFPYRLEDLGGVRLII